MSGVHGPDAGFALATAGLGSAVVLNVMFWIGLMISIPIRGVNPFYGTAAIAGMVLMRPRRRAWSSACWKGQGRAERVLRWLARKLRLNEDRAAAGVRHIGSRLEDLASDRQLLSRVIGWAAANWLLDAAALWVFLRPSACRTDVDALIVAFGLANMLAVIPITPGGLGHRRGASTSPRWSASASPSDGHRSVSATYRLAQFLFPILLGGVLYVSLRVGPWSIKRRERLRAPARPRRRDRRPTSERARLRRRRFAAPAPAGARSTPAARRRRPPAGEGDGDARPVS